MLEKDPHDRITVEAALEDEYFRDISKDEPSLEETKI
jgi:serine/threonine protein kinase